MNTFKNIIDLLLQILLIIFSYFVKKDNNVLIFGAGVGKSFKGNTKYLFLYGIKQTKFDCYWITRNKKLYQDLKNSGYPVLYLYSLDGCIKILKSNILFIEMGAQDCVFTGQIFGKFNFFNLRHGTPLKKIGDDMISDNKVGSLNLQYKIRNLLGDKFKSSKNLKYISSSSNFVSNILKKAFDNDNVYVTGYPRNDIFFDSSFIMSDFYDELHLSKYNKIITYAPTFRDNCSINPFTQDFLLQLDSYCKEKKYLFILKLHPYDKSILFDMNKYEHIKNIGKDIDLQELLVYTDILITDYSSVFFDFMITSKPIIYYSYDYDFYIKSCRGMYFDYYQHLPGPFIQNETQLIPLIDSIDIWFHQEEYKNKYTELNNKFNTYTDGNSCQRVFTLITKNK